MIKWTKYCRKAIAGSLVMAPTDKQKNNFNDSIINVKKSSLIVAKKLFEVNSDKGLPKFEESLDKMFFILPRNTEEQKEFIDKSFASVVNSNSHIDMEGLSDEEVVSILPMGLIIDMMGESEKTIFSEVRDLCKSFIPKSQLGDRTTTVHGGVWVSAWSVKQPKKGAGVLAHEIGHTVESHFTAYIDKSKLQCFEDNHREYKTNYVKKGQYFGEDFADSFSVKVLKELKISKKENNFACLLSGNDLETNKDEHIDMFKPLLNENKKDVHPSSFYRLLQMASELEETPESCKSIIDFSNDVLKSEYPMVRSCL